MDKVIEGVDVSVFYPTQKITSKPLMDPKNQIWKRMFEMQNQSGAANSQMWFKLGTSFIGKRKLPCD